MTYSESDRFDPTKVIDSFDGGLNTNVSNISMSPQDSPELINVDITDSGKITKRRGTNTLSGFEVVGSLPDFNNPAGVKPGIKLTNFNSTYGYSFVIEKSGKNLNIYFVANDKVSLVTQKTNVWDDLAESVKPSCTTITGLITRILFTTGVNQPVQLSIVEKKWTIRDFDTSGRAILLGAEDFIGATSSNNSPNSVLFLKNGIPFTPGGFAVGEGLLVDIPGAVVGDEIYVIYFSWQHIVDALIYRGFRLNQNTTRFSNLETDINLQIPIELRDGIDYIEDGNYPIRIDSNNTLPQDYTYVPTNNPSTAYEYSFGDGSLFDNGFTNPSPNFVSFGALNSTPQPISIFRYRSLNSLNGGVGVRVSINNSDLQVRLNGEIKTSIFNTYQSDYSLIQTGQADYIAFNKLENGKAGVPRESVVKIIHRCVNFIGTGATTSTSDLVDGSCFPMYGLGAYANYYSGSFPSLASVFRGRLIFSGFENNPNLLLFSEIYDYSFVTELYNNFMIDEFSVDRANAFDLFINSDETDYITGIIPWQENLFVFTRQACFRINSPQGTSLSNDTAFYTLISKKGLINSHCLTLTDRSVMFLSDTGVYEIVFGVNDVDINLRDVSEKIRNKLIEIIKKSPLNKNYWLSYNDCENKVFLGLPSNLYSDTSYYLFVLNTFNNAWTEYSTIYGWQLYDSISYYDSVKGYGFLSAVAQNRQGNLITRKEFIRWNGDTYLDFYNSSSTDSPGLGTDSTFDISFKVISSVPGKRYYDTGFNLSPILSVEDIYVELETGVNTGIYQKLEFNTNYVKAPNNQIYFFINFNASLNIKIRPRLPVNNPEYGSVKYPTGDLGFYNAFRNGNLLLEGTDYIIDYENNNIFFSFISANTVFNFGLPYISYYVSPSFDLRSLALNKQLRHIYLYFDNDLYFDEDFSLNANLFIRFSSYGDGDVSYDIYGIEDTFNADIKRNPNTNNLNSIFKAYVLGSGLTYQLIVGNFDYTTFTLSGYQLDVRPNAERRVI